MHHHAQVVQQYPSGVGVALSVVGRDGRFLERIQDFLVDGVKLAVGLAAADDDVIGE